MSKYKERGAYHYAEFDDPTSIYHKHVVDLLKNISEVVDDGSRILDVGSGEGLILHQLSLNGFLMTGCDVDPIAVRLAAEKGNVVCLGTIDLFKGQSFDVVMLCDVLEHVDDFEGTILAAKRLAGIVVVAVPDGHDRHAVRQNTTGMVIDQFSRWELALCRTRHARRLMIFRHINE